MGNSNRYKPIPQPRMNPIKRLAIRGAYLAVSLVIMYFVINWALGQVLNAAVGVPASMKAAEQTRTALTPTPVRSLTPAPQK